MKNYKLILLATTVLVLAAFSKSFSQDIAIPKPELNKLFGIWDWLQSTGGRAGATIFTPATSGHSTLVFEKDGTMKGYKNGKKISEIKFTFKNGSAFHKDSAYFIVPVKPGVWDEIKFVGNDTLKLEDRLDGGMGSIYVRKK